MPAPQPTFLATSGGCSDAGGTAASERPLEAWFLG